MFMLVSECARVYFPACQNTWNVLYFSNSRVQASTPSLPPPPSQSPLPHSQKGSASDFEVLAAANKLSTSLLLKTSNKLNWLPLCEQFAVVGSGSCGAGLLAEDSFPVVLVAGMVLAKWRLQQYTLKQ